MLYKNEATYEDIINIFGYGPKGDKQNVMLNKFLNSLRIFGIKIEKRNNKFIMQNMPFSIDFDYNDLKALSIFEKLSKNITNEKIKSEFQQFLKYIKIHFDSNTSLKYKNILENNSNDYSFYHENLREQILECVECINLNFKIRLKYFNMKGEEIECYCTPKEIIYDNKQAYLKIYKQKENVIDNVKISSIINIEYLPTIKTEQANTMTVAFRLKGRLAKAYTLKEGEKISEYGKDGSILIINQNEPIDTLLARLMRYDSNCIIERPKFLKAQMKKLINDTLKIYE